MGGRLTDQETYCQLLVGKQLREITTDPPDMPGVTLLSNKGYSYVYEEITLTFEDGTFLKVKAHLDETLMITVDNGPQGEEGGQPAL